MVSLKDLATNLFNKGKQTVNPILQQLDRDKAIPGFQFAQGGLTNRVNQVLQQPISVPKPIYNAGSSTLQTLKRLPTSAYVMGRGQETANRIIGGVSSFKQPGLVNKGIGALQLAGGVLGLTPAGQRVEAITGTIPAFLKTTSQAMTNQNITPGKNLIRGITGQETIGTSVNPITKKLFGDQKGELASQAIDLANLITGVYKGGRFDPQTRYLQTIENLPDNFKIPQLLKTPRINTSMRANTTFSDPFLPVTDLKRPIDKNKVSLIARLFGEAKQNGGSNPSDIRDIQSLARTYLKDKNLSRLSPEMIVTELYKHAVGKGIQTYASEIKTPRLSVEPVAQGGEPSTSVPQTKQSLPGKIPQTELGQVPPGSSTIISPKSVSSADIVPRKLVTSIQEAPNIVPGVKSQVSGTYKVKPNTQLMGEAQALLQSGASIDFKNTKNLDQKVAATIKQAVAMQQTNPEAAANLFNNLSEHATELGRGVQAFSLLERMSPEAVALSAAGKIKKYNLTARRKIPELSGGQVQMISDQVSQIDKLSGREKNIAINQLSDTINSFIPSSLVDKALTVWKAGLLTSLRTHERNLIGNSIMGAAETGKDVLATPFDALLSLRTGQRTLTPTLNTGEGFKKGFQSAKDVFTTGFDPEEVISKYDVKKINWANTPIQQGLKKYTDFVFQSLGAEDKPFWHSSYARSLYDQAGAEAINAGRQGDKKFIQSLVDNPTEQMLVNATKDANYATFKDENKLTSLANQFKNWAGKAWYTKIPAEVFAPFTGVPSSVVGKTIDYSPIGLIKGIAEAGNVLVNNVPELQRQAAQDLGRGLMGSALFGLGAYLVSKGLMTGNPKDAKEADQWKLEGKQANSVLLGGKWRSINSVGPQNLIMLAGAKYQQEMGPNGGGTGAYLGGLAKDQLQQTFLQGVQAPLQAINDPARYGQSFVGGTAASIIPNIVKDTSKSFDPYQRNTNSVGDYLKTGIPGVRNTLTPKRDVLGNPLKQEPSGVNAFFDLFNSKTPISNVVVDELARLNNAGNIATPSQIDKNQTILKNKVVLDPKQLDSLQAGAGKELQVALGKLFQSRGYQSLTDEKKAKAISDAVSNVRTLYKVIHGKDLLQGVSLANPTYTQSADSPKNKVGLYIQAGVADPKATIHAVVTGQPIRKIRGSTVILERQDKLSGLDAGDPNTQVDHKIPLALGGTNDASNLEVISATDNAAKGKVETYLAKLLTQGKITESEALKRAKDWRNEIKNMPKSDQAALVKVVSDAAFTSDPSKQYQIINPETGSFKTIDLTPINPPNLTGDSLIDSKLKSSYKSALTRQINNVVELYKDGQISLDEAKELTSQLESKKSGKKAKKITVKAPKLAAFKIKKYTPPKVKTSKVPKLKSYKPKKISSNTTKIAKISAPKIARAKIKSGKKGSRLKVKA